MRTTPIFWSFLLLHGIAWTIIPTLFQPNASLDIIECATWGRESQWGYEKHPPLASWLAEIFIVLFGRGNLWPFLLLSQLSILAGFFCVWRLARYSLTPEKALLSVLLLEGVYYYNYTSPEWNPNVLLLALWPLCILLLRRSIHSDRWHNWLLLGAACGFAVLAKYYSVFLLASMLLYLMVHKETRQRLYTAGPWIALAMFFTVIAPHLYWGWINGFSTLSYGINRSAGGGGFSAHAWHPLRFLLAQGMAIAPVIALVIMLSGKAGPKLTDKLNNFETRFILTFTLLPLLLTVLVSILFGLRLKSMWGTPLWPLAGIALLLLWQPEKLHMRRFAILWSFLFLLAPTVYAVQLHTEPHFTGHTGRTHFPGEEVAHFLAREWQERYRTQLPAVGGSLWLAGNVAFYAPQRPPVYVDLEHRKSLWMDDVKFSASGGIIVWDGAYFQLPPFYELFQRFPAIKIQKNRDFSWQTNVGMPPFTLGWAIVPPHR